ncbi:hypothetical protein Hdeb2414_s0027g00691781 [Helianthus debilis subsp. tardiflorus]
MFNPPIAEGDVVSTGGIFGDADNSLFGTLQRTAGVGNAVGGTLFSGQANMTGVGFVERGSSSGAFETPLIPTSQPTDNGLVWYPRQPPMSPTTPCHPPQTPFGSPPPALGHLLSTTAPQVQLCRVSGT